MKNIIGILILIAVLISCGSRSKLNESKVTSLLELTNDSLVFHLDDSTHVLAKTLYQFTDDRGNEYFTFQNGEANEILIFDMKSGQLLKKIRIDYEGANGVTRFIGYYINSLDEIYLSRPDKCEIILIDGNGNIKKKYNYESTDDGQMLIPGFFSTIIYTPLVFIEELMYIPQDLNPMLSDKMLERSSVTITIDTLTNGVKNLPMRFPPIVSVEDVKNHKTVGNEFSYSRCFNGRQFVYSFFYDEDIYITNPEHDSIFTRKAKSKYIDKVSPLGYQPDNLIQSNKIKCEVPMYRNLIYDEYREVYYRLVYPQTEMEKNEDYYEVFQFGRKAFSIIILNKDFEIIGETLFPEYTYVSGMMFVRKDGLYISDSHYKNPSFNENVLSFRRFELKNIED